MFDSMCLYNKNGITLKKILFYTFNYSLHVTCKDSGLAALAEKGTYFMAFGEAGITNTSMPPSLLISRKRYYS